nr:MAG TPA: single-stranded DNA-binding protein [Caudoviricetes sp.]
MQEINKVNITGIMIGVGHTDEVAGIPFKGHILTLLLQRTNDKIDEVIAVISDNINNNIDRIGVNIPVSIQGEIQTTRDYRNNKVYKYVLVDKFEILELDEFSYSNHIKLCGTIKHIAHRKLNAGIKITDFKVTVNNRLTGKVCYIPCVSWDRNAETVKNWNAGDTVELCGKIRSRDYIKATEEGDVEEKRAYEISVDTIKRINTQ